MLYSKVSTHPCLWERGPDLFAKSSNLREWVVPRPNPNFRAMHTLKPNKSRVEDTCTFKSRPEWVLVKEGPTSPTYIQRTYFFLIAVSIRYKKYKLSSSFWVL